MKFNLNEFMYSPFAAVKGEPFAWIARGRFGGWPMDCTLTFALHFGPPNEPSYTAYT